MIGPGMLTLILAIGVLTGVGGSRNMRGIILSYKENMYVKAAVAVGCPFGRILTRHLLPNVMPFIITGYAIVLPAVIISEAALSFLGFGVPPPTPSWGGMLSGPGRENMFLAPWMAVWPGLALSIAVYGISMFGDALRDLLDPRLKGGVGRFGVKTDKIVASLKTDLAATSGQRKGTQEQTAAGRD
jgi:peptide/nickel transport system permease protein